MRWLMAALFLMGCAASQLTSPDPSNVEYIYQIRWYTSITEGDYYQAISKGRIPAPSAIYYTFQYPIFEYRGEGLWVAYFYDINGEHVYLEGAGIFIVRQQINESLPYGMPESNEVP